MPVGTEDQPIEDRQFSAPPLDDLFYTDRDLEFAYNLNPFIYQIYSYSIYYLLESTLERC